MTDLIRTDPCDACDQRRTIYDVPPYDICVASPAGDFDCALTIACTQLADMAAEFAERIKTIDDPAVRREVCEGVAGGIANGLWTLARSTRFDDAEFERRCGLEEKT